MPYDNNFRYTNAETGESADVGCLAEYGGPAFPYVALGDFRHGESDIVTDESLYLNASALILTFVVNNKQNKSEQVPARDWEKA